LLGAFRNPGYDSCFAAPIAKTLVKYNKDIQRDRTLFDMTSIRPESLSRLAGMVNIAQSQADMLRMTSYSKATRCGAENRCLSLFSKIFALEHKKNPAATPFATGLYKNYYR